MITSLQQANENFVKVFQTMFATQLPHSTGPPGQPGPGPAVQRSQVHTGQLPPIPPAHQGIPQAQLPPQQPPNRQLLVPNPTIQKKRPQPPAQQGPSTSTSSAVAISTPPAPPASTPASNAPTPTHATGSPSTPRSPKAKATSKPKASAAKRKVSKVVPPPVEPAQPPAQSQPSQPPTPNSKRAREEDVPSSSAAPSEPSPPKKAKTSEWEGPPSEALKQRQSIDGINDEEQASTFLNNMQSLIEIAGQDGQESVQGILEDILKCCGSVELGEGSALSIPSMPLGDTPHEATPASTHPSAADEFVEYFDFSSFGTLDEEEGTPTTPDLISSSSTNPSPESGSEADAAHQHTTDLARIADPDLDDFSDSASDPLRLGAFREIDGGESAYYQSENWKWDGSMPVLEQPWAIFTT
jgi:hypothetical protein